MVRGRRFRVSNLLGLVLSCAVAGCGRTEQTASHRSTVSSADEARPVRERGMQVDTPLVTVDLKANGEDGRLVVPKGSVVELTWTTVGAAFCLGPLGSLTLSGSVRTPPIEDSTTHVLTCKGAEGTASDTVRIDIGDPSDQPPGPVVPLEVIRENGVDFCSAGATRLLLDIAYPKMALGPRPAIVFVHGGRWLDGSRDEFSREIAAAAEKSYVAVTIDYRLVGGDFTGQVEDVKCAVRWLRANAAKYGVDEAKIGLLGAAAGAQVALIAAYSGPEEFQGAGGHQEKSASVRAVVNWSGATDLTSLYETLSGVEKVALRTLLGGEPSDAQAAYAVASPVTYVSAGDPPTWTTHGDANTRVPRSQPESLDQALKAVAVTHTLQLLPGQGNDFDATGAATALAGAFSFFESQFSPLMP